MGKDRINPILDHGKDRFYTYILKTGYSGIVVPDMYVIKAVSTNAFYRIMNRAEKKEKRKQQKTKKDFRIS